MSTASPANVGDDLISPSVLNVQRRRPSLTLTACTIPVRSPTYTAPPPTAGDDSPMAPPVEYFHFNLPEPRSSATRSPLAVAAYTLPSTMAGDESRPSAVS